MYRDNNLSSSSSEEDLPAHKIFKKFTNNELRMLQKQESFNKDKQHEGQLMNALNMYSKKELESRFKN